MKFSSKVFFSKYDQICRFPRIWSHLLNKPLLENFIFCEMPLIVLCRSFWFELFVKMLKQRSRFLKSRVIWCSSQSGLFFALMLSSTLRKMCLYSELFWFAFGGKMRTRITPKADTFYAVQGVIFILKKAIFVWIFWNLAQLRTPSWPCFSWYLHQNWYFDSWFLRKSSY